MKLTDLFIRRPVLAVVVNLVILIAGIQSVRSLSVRQYPRSDIAVVKVSTVYVGANADLVRGFMERCEDDPCFGHCEAVLGAHRPDPVHPAHREKQCRSVRRRRSAPGHPGVPALRDEGHPVISGEPDDLSNFLGRGRREHRGRGAVDAPAPVGQPRLNLLGVRDDGLWAELLLSFGDQPCFAVRHGLAAWHAPYATSKQVR